MAIKTQISDDLLTSYNTAEFHVFHESSFILKIGVYSDELSQIFSTKCISSAAFITAYNPYSKELTIAENKLRNKDLEDLIIKMKYDYIRGDGKSGNGDWEGEASFLILDIDEESSKFLGNQFEQNAIVWCDLDSIPQLVLLR